MACHAYRGMLECSLLCCQTPESNKLTVDQASGVNIFDCSPLSIEEYLRL
jgi:hypothetical protein